MIRILIAILLVLTSHLALCQTLNLTMEEAISLAQGKSLAILKAETEKENSYWSYRTFRANYNPQLTLSGSLFDFNRTFQPVTQPDGNILFQPISNNNTSLQLGISQPISATGTEIFAQSQIQRFDDFPGDLTRYSSNPFLVGIRQPFFGFNYLKWDRSIEPLKYEESIRTYGARTEDISRTTVRLYFELLVAQERLKAEQSNLDIIEELLKTSELRHKQGYISKNDWLLIQLSRNNILKTIYQTELAINNQEQALKTFLNISEDDRTIQLNIPLDVPNLIIDEDMAWEYARKNRHEVITFERQKLEAERDIAQAKGERFSVDMFATLGISNRASELQELYMETRDRQTFLFGFSIPILDWGRAEAKLQTALATQKLVNFSVEQDLANLKLEISNQVRQIETLQLQLNLADENKEIAQESYKLTASRYKSGEIGINELNISRELKDQALTDYVLALRDYWQAYYELRYLTLYDFQKDRSLLPSINQRNE